MSSLMLDMLFSWHNWKFCKDRVFTTDDFKKYYALLVFYKTSGSRPSGKSFLIFGYILVLKVSKMFLGLMKRLQ